MPLLEHPARVVSASGLPRVFWGPGMGRARGRPRYMRRGLCRDAVNGRGRFVGMCCWNDWASQRAAP
eukprot:10271166-Lingulodinium_polyedra.AAC.1